MRRCFECLCLAVAVFTLIGACQGKGSHAPDTSIDDSVPQQTTPPPRSVALESLVAEIAATAPPEGIEADLYARLKEQLIHDIKARGVCKIVATPPLGEINQVTDLKLYGDETVGFRLVWTFVNAGDLNLDGLVSVNDLTPIGQNFNESVDGNNWATAYRADGNGDGLVSVGDITPIGQNYQTFCQGYNVYGSANADGPWSAIGELPLPVAPPNTPFEISYDVPGGGYWYYQIRPHDSEGSEGVASQVSRPTIEPVKVSLGADNYLTTATIEPGGTVVETELGSPDQHIKFTFPAGAVTEPMMFQLGTNDGTYVPYMGELKSPIVAMAMGGEQSFGEPVTIEVKFDRFDLTKAIVPFIVDDEGRTHLVDLIAMKSPEFTATFETCHLFHHLLWLVEDPAMLQQVPDGGMRSTGFTPKYDGFYVDNGPETWWSGSSGFGMVAFANWYYCSGRTWSEGNFRPRFLYKIDPPAYYYGQEVIAVRANAAIIHDWPTYWTNYIEPLLGVSQAQKFAAVVNGLANSGHPVLMRLYGYGGWYSVLATGYDADGIFIYDPYKPGQEHYLHFDHATKRFDPYEGRIHFYYSGPGALWVQEPYLYILNDAKSHFDWHGASRVQITSHTSGQQLSAGDVVISGTVDSTYLLAEKLLVLVENEFTWVTVTPEGGFSANVPIEPGWNHFSFEAYSTAAGDVEVELVTLMEDGEHFALEGI